MQNQQKYKAAKYLRISRDDGDRTESDSIRNQREFLNGFLKNHAEITYVQEYVDDGYSGSNFDRPSFRQMIEDVKAKKINCIIVKDLSRFGRNYIDTGNYLERVFPVLGVRFIAINDNYDSANEQSRADDIVIPFKNLINDSYCRDISIKTRSHLDVKRRAGQFVGSFAAYGYKKDPNDKNHLIADEYAAGVIRNIFDSRLQGMNPKRIAESLNAAGVLPPSEYKRRQGMNYTNGFRAGTDSKWLPKTVDRILKNELYMGIMIQGKRKKVNYKVNNIRSLDENEWIKTEGKHEAIIPKEMFVKVQQLMGVDTRTPPGKEQVYLFSGFVRCGDCGKKMCYNTAYAKGRTYRYLRCEKGCLTRYISEIALERVVLRAIQRQASLVCKTEDMINHGERAAYLNNKSTEIDNQIKELEAEIIRFNDLKAKLYQDFRDGIVSSDEYQEIGNRFSKKIQKANKSKEMLSGKCEDLQCKNLQFHPWINELKKYGQIQSLDRGVLISLIDEIVIYNGNTVEIRFLFRDELEEFMKVSGTVCPIKYNL